MTSKIKVLRLEKCIEEIKTYINNSTLIPVIGSGFSAGSETSRGIVPNGKEMKQFMIDKLSQSDIDIKLEGKSFSQIAKYYNRLIDASVRKKYLADNFIGAKLSSKSKSLLEINWPYIYTLNIDDAIEKSSDYVPIGPNKALEQIKYDGKILYKLHGTAQDIAFLKEGDSFSVFDSEQYISSLTNNKWLLNKLKQDYIDKNILFFGCSLDDEIDLMHVFSLVKQSNPQVITEKYFLTNKTPGTESLIDLESYGITKVILVDNYDDFYDILFKIKEELKLIPNNKLDIFKNIKIQKLGLKNEKNKEYVLFSKLPYDKKNQVINLPYFFTNRNLTTTIVQDFGKFPVQFIYGKRVSGKSYLLLDILTRLNNRDKYYFDSRSRISKENIDTIFERRNIAVLIDTNVLSDDLLRYIIKYDHSKLQEQNINVVICVNTSSKESAIELRNTLDSKTMQIYYIENKFESNDHDDEYEILKRKLTSINMPYFHRDKTILDSILWIQNKLLTKQSNYTLKDFQIDPENYLQAAYLILMVHIGKLTTADLVKYQLMQEPFELMPKLDKAVEPDFRPMITSSINDSSYYQIVCNAQAWLMGYISRISLKQMYFNTITKAVVYIVKRMVENTNIKKRDKELFDFIKFDNLNMLLGGARKKGEPFGARRLIQNIYLELKELIGEQYQFNHQYAKCLLWGIEELEEPRRSNELQESLQSAILATQLVNDLMTKNEKNPYLAISFAHIQFTLSMIYVKRFFFNQNQKTFSEAVDQLEKALRLKENQNAYELNDEITNDDNDYSVSKFIDYLVSPESQNYSATLKKQISWIVNFRYQYTLRNK